MGVVDLDLVNPRAVSNMETALALEGGVISVVLLENHPLVELKTAGTVGEGAVYFAGGRALL